MSFTVVLTTPYGPVEVHLPARTKHDAYVPTFSGPDPGQQLVQRWLRHALGAFGQPIGRTASPLDLCAALESEEGSWFLGRVTAGEALLGSDD